MVKNPSYSESTTILCCSGSTMVNPEEFTNFVLQLGGMHQLMSFCEAVATLVEGSCFAEILCSTFGSVNKMLTGKKFPQNDRAFCIAVYGKRNDVEKFILDINSMEEC